MISVKYTVGVYNPVKEHLKPSESYLEYSTLEVKGVSTGYSVKGFYKKNKEILVASSNCFIGEEFYLKSGKGNKTFLEQEQTFLDVEEIFGLNGLNLRYINNKFKNNINSSTYIKNNIYKLNHILAEKEDAIFFKLTNSGILELIDVVCKSPTNLIEFSEPDIFIVYYLVNKTLKVSPYSNYHIPTRQLEDLPQGFCSLSNELLLNNTLSIEGTSINNYIVRGMTPTTISSTFPIKFDNVLLTNYKTTPREVILLSVEEGLSIPLNSVDIKVEDNLTAIYEILSNGTLEPYLLVDSNDILEHPDSYLLSYTNKDRPLVLNSDKEFKKNYIVKQYKIKLKDSSNKEYILYDDSFYNNILKDIVRFNKKIMK